MHAQQAEIWGLLESERSSHDAERLNSVLGFVPDLVTGGTAAAYLQAE